MPGTEHRNTTIESTVDAEKKTEEETNKNSAEVVKTVFASTDLSSEIVGFLDGKSLANVESLKRTKRSIDVMVGFFEFDNKKVQEYWQNSVNKELTENPQLLPGQTYKIFYRKAFKLLKTVQNKIKERSSDVLFHV